MSCRALRKFALGLILVLVATSPLGVVAQEAGDEAEIHTAPVVIDGTELFRVRGVAVYPAEQRAARIAARIVDLAKDRQVGPDRVVARASTVAVDIGTADRLVMAVHDADGAIARINRSTLADLYVRRIRQSIEDYRTSRSSQYLRFAAVRAFVATVIGLVALYLTRWALRSVASFARQRYQAQVPSIAIQSFEILRARQIWSALVGTLHAARYVAVAAILYLYVEYVLRQFPWTRALGQQLLDHLVKPLATMGDGLLRILPDLIFLAVLAVITRYLLRILRLFFDAVDRGSVNLGGFDSEWARPTYRIIRFGVVVFVLVVAYPFIPGSGSEAFKGISIFLGVVFSIGSTSFVANFVAGYALLYRRAFKVGDWVRVADAFGEVVQVRVQVTHLRTLRNEEIILPNSLVLSTEVINYSSLGGSRGLVIQASVSIGYGTPWRQVEAMLLLASGRTAGLLPEPAPFVQQIALGDFAVTYEINAFCDTPHRMIVLRSALHRSILDVFNEYGVQIMTPAYEGDPAEPKIVPSGAWYAPPAVTPKGDVAPGAARSTGVRAAES